MGDRDFVLKEIKAMPDELVKEVAIFIKFLEYKEYEEKEKRELLFMSQTALEKEWLLPEEDETWKNL